MRRIVLWVTGLLVLAIALVVVLVEVFSVTSEFSVKNGATEPIVRATVNVAGKVFAFENIEPGATVTGTYRPSDSVFVVRVTMSSGKVFDGSAGYITNGITYRHDVVVSDSGIKVFDRELK